MKPITENIIEESAIDILQLQGWEYTNGKEIKTLTKLRYTLLPKLMSSEVRVEN